MSTDFFFFRFTKYDARFQVFKHNKWAKLKRKYSIHNLINLFKTNNLLSTNTARPSFMLINQLLSQQLAGICIFNKQTTVYTQNMVII